MATYLRDLVRRTAAPLLFVALFSLALAAPAATAASGCPSSVATAPRDFNGDGHEDSVIGIPGANDATGAIEVDYRGQTPVELSPGVGGVSAMPVGSRFGAALLVDDLNGDGCVDLFVGAPGLPVAGAPEAGGVQTFLGSSDGLRPAALLTQASLQGEPEANAHFGAAIGDGQWVEVGAPGATVNDAQDSPQRAAGKVTMFTHGPDGSPNGQFIQERTMSDPQAQAHFGAVIFQDFVGAPDADHGSKVDTGYVEVEREGFYGRAAGDRLGASITNAPHTHDAFWVYVGAPGSTVKGHHNAGAVVPFDDFYEAVSGVTREPRLTQATPGVAGKPRTGTRFGASLTSIETNKDRSTPQHDTQCRTLLVGMPGATVQGHHGAGAIAARTIVHNNETGKRVVHWIIKTQASPAVPGKPQAHSHFGAAVASSRTTNSFRHASATVGAPDADVDGNPDAGLALEFTVSWRGDFSDAVTKRTRAAGAAATDHFAAALPRAR